MKNIWFLEGNISSGKSTLLNSLRSHGYTVYEEPIIEWKERYCQPDGENILGLFYRDMNRWSFTFELVTMMTRLERLASVLESSDDTIIVERSPFSSALIFASNCYAQKHMTPMEWLIYREWIQPQLRSLKKTLQLHRVRFLYLRTSPSICHYRTMSRGCVEENAVTLDYLAQLHVRYDEWLFDMNVDYPVEVIDGSLPVTSVLVNAMTAINS